MSTFGRSKPLFMRTYGRGMRKVDRWISPDLRKKAFSFSTSLSSEASVVEHDDSVQAQRKKRKKKSVAAASRRGRPSKQRALTAVREPDSDEENASMHSAGQKDHTQRKKKEQRVMKSQAGRQTLRCLNASDGELPTLQRQPIRKGRRQPRQPALSTSASEDDSAPKNVKTNAKLQRGPATERQAGSGMGVRIPAMGKFVTHRRRHPSVKPPTRNHKKSFHGPSWTLNSSEDFVQNHPKAPVPKYHGGEFGLESSLTSFSDSLDRPRLSCKRPLLSSTPSIVSRRARYVQEPSVSEISSLGQDEAEALGSEQGRGGGAGGEAATLERSSAVGALAALQEVLSADGSPGTEFESARMHMDPQEELLIARCLRRSVKVSLERIDISLIQSERDPKRDQEVEAFSSCLDGKLSSQRMQCSPVTTEGPHGEQTDGVHPSNLSSSSSFIVPPLPPSLSLIDRLKGECLSSCLAVVLAPLDPRVLKQIHQGALHLTGSVDASSAEEEMESWHSSIRGRGSGSHSPLSSGTECWKDPPALGNNGPKHRLSSSFGPAECPGTRAPPGSRRAGAPIRRERTGTGRKAGISGLSISRWSRKDTRDQNQNQRRKNPAVRSKAADSSASDLQSFTVEPLSSWLQGSTLSLAVTPLKVEKLNLSSILANFTPNTLTTHTWSRLKAALSIHKKKTAFVTPWRLALPGLASPGEAGHDGSMDLFGSPAVTPGMGVMASCLQATPQTPYGAAGISDAAKVFQECLQDGPLCFSECLPPPRMKACRKIGEGTFGEVFSTNNHLNQTVALKIIPVEGRERVNGEEQKTFGEILHEIIISKELSSLSTKEQNQSDGFIGLNNLHCVCGRYPEELLVAWDKYDQQRGSENDRPDFFSDEQLFLIFEFEFGGSDLENMNGKLSSFAQAKSILHQVTAALAVAEQGLCFEHRDLHWGNILVKTTKQKQSSFTLNGQQHAIESRGVQVNIIDYSLSRLEIDGLTVSCDISQDEELFMGAGDYQFDIYRLMRTENSNCWSEYNPHSNVLWLHYLADKLLGMSYRSKSQSVQQRAVRSSLSAFRSQILSCGSATDALQSCGLFQ